MKYTPQELDALIVRVHAPEFNKLEKDVLVNFKQNI